jgi:hypothetical protein
MDIVRDSPLNGIHSAPQSCRIGTAGIICAVPVPSPVYFGGATAAENARFGAILSVFSPVFPSAA